MDVCLFVFEKVAQFGINLIGVAAFHFTKLRQRDAGILGILPLDKALYPSKQFAIG